MVAKKRKRAKPKSKQFNWIGLITPFIFAIILGLITLVYNGMAKDFEKMEVAMDQKVDNKTLQMQIEVLKEKNKEAGVFRDKTNDRIEKMLMEMQQIKIQQQAPVYNPPTGITKEQYDFYIKLTPSQKIQFKKLHPEFQGLP